MPTPVRTLVYAANCIGSGWNVESGAATFTCSGGETIVLYQNGLANADQGSTTLTQPSGGTITPSRISGAFNSWISSASTYGGFSAVANAQAGTYTINPFTVIGGNDGIIRVYVVTNMPSTLTIRTTGKLEQANSSNTITITGGAYQANDIAFGGRCHENSAGSNDTITQPLGWTSDAQYLNGTLNIPTDNSSIVFTGSGTLSATWTDVDPAITDTSAAVLVLVPLQTNTTITSQPTSTSTTANGFAPLSVGITGATGTAHYQWTVNGVNTGPDSATFNYQPTLAGVYSVAVTITDDLGSVTSNAVSLRVFKALPRKFSKKRPLISVDNSGFDAISSQLFTDALFDPTYVAQHTSGGSGNVNASLTATESADSVNAGTTSLIQTSLSGLESPDTAADALSVLIQATATITEGGDSSSSLTNVLVQTAASNTESADTLSATAGAGAVNTTLTVTEVGDTSSSSSSVLVTATVTSTEASDSLASASAVQVSSTLTTTEGADSTSSTSSVTVATSLVATENADATNAGSTVTVTANLSTTEAADTMTATAGAPAAVLNLTVTEAADSVSTTAAVTVGATLNTSENGDIASSGATVLVNAAASILEAADGLAAALAVGLSASLSATEATDTLTANSSGPGVQASLTAMETADSLSFIAAVQVAAQAVLDEASDSVSSASVAQVSASAGIIEGLDGISSDGSVAVTGGLTVTEGSDQPVSDSSTQVTANYTATEHDDALIAFIQTVIDQSLIYIDPGLQPYTNGDLTYIDRSLTFGQ